jgi:hypothetical protein
VGAWAVPQVTTVPDLGFASVEILLLSHSSEER